MNKQAKEDYEIIWNELVKVLPRLLKEGRNGQIKLRLRKLKAAFDKIFEENEDADTIQKKFDKQKEIYNSLEEDIDNPQIDNPTHYQSMVVGLDIDAISCMRAAFGDEDVKAFCLCNSLKYIFRSSSKGQNQSIAKAMWYLNKFLELGGYE